jgi:putative membrane protein
MSLVATAAIISTGVAQTGQSQGGAHGNPAGTPAGTRHTAPGTPAPHQLNDADRKFLVAATKGGTAEVQFAQLAGRASRNADVKQFAQRMLSEHQEANRRLVALGQNAGVPPMQDLDADHKAVHDRLSKLQGAEFDRSYIASQVVDHQVMAQLLVYEIGSGQDKELKGLASELLPTILDHLQAAHAVLATLAVTAAR